jgi:uncharacterized membrane protein
MATLLGVLMFSVPIVVVLAMLWVTEQRQARRRDEVLRQIALTDALHARLGAVVAPVVRWRDRAWRVAVAVPFERPEVVAAVLATVHDAFERARYEVVLTRQAPAAALPRASRRARLGEESLSWT